MPFDYPAQLGLNLLLPSSATLVPNPQRLTSIVEDVEAERKPALRVDVDEVDETEEISGQSAETELEDTAVTQLEETISNDGEQISTTEGEALEAIEAISTREAAIGKNPEFNAIGNKKSPEFNVFGNGKTSEFNAIDDRKNPEFSAINAIGERRRDSFLDLPFFQVPKRLTSTKDSVTMGGCMDTYFLVERKKWQKTPQTTYWTRKRPLEEEEGDEGGKGDEQEGMERWRGEGGEDDSFPAMPPSSRPFRQFSLHAVPSSVSLKVKVRIYRVTVKKVLVFGEKRECMGCIIK